MRHPNSERFHELLRLAGETHDAKQLDYGSATDPFANVRRSEDLGIPGWCGAILRNNDKQIRLQKAVRDTIERGSPVLANEGVKDSLLDQAVYALIAYVLYEEWEQKQEPQYAFEGLEEIDISNWLNFILGVGWEEEIFKTAPQDIHFDRSLGITAGDMVRILEGVRTGEYAFVDKVNEDGTLCINGGVLNVPQTYFLSEVELVG